MIFGLFGGDKKRVAEMIAAPRTGDTPVACAIQVDPILLMDFDLAMEPVFGGSLSDDLTKLVPRLPKGIPAQDIPKITGVKQRKPRPTLSLGGAQAEVSRLIGMRTT